MTRRARARTPIHLPVGRLLEHAQQWAVAPLHPRLSNADRCVKPRTSIPSCNPGPNPAIKPRPHREAADIDVNLRAGSGILIAAAVLVGRVLARPLSRQVECSLEPPFGGA